MRRQMRSAWQRRSKIVENLVPLTMIGLVFSLSANIALARKGHGKEKADSKTVLPPRFYCTGAGVRAVWCLGSNEKTTDFIDRNRQNGGFGSEN